jgi:hypothetical protein
VEGPVRKDRIRNRLRRIVAVGAVLVAVAVAAPATAAPAGAGTDTAVDCTAGRITGQVCRLYQAYFLRLPDADGIDHWRRSLAAGLSLAAVSDGFAGSPEFIARYGALDDRGFVSLVYRNVLGREPDLGGLDHWARQLAAGASRGTVMTGFSESAEFVGRTGTPGPTTDAVGAVARLYLAYFGRQPDTSGLISWVGRLGAGTRLADVSQAFAGSPEFVGRYGTLGDDAFVDLVYRNVLGRSADPSGLAHWVGRLQSGASRGAVMLGFSESVEFRLATESRLPDPIADDRLVAGALTVFDVASVACRTSGGTVTVYWAIAVLAPTRPSADGMIVHNDAGWAALVGSASVPVATGGWSSPATVVRAGTDRLTVPAGQTTLAWDGSGCSRQLR